MTCDTLATTGQNALTFTITCLAALSLIAVGVILLTHRTRRQRWGTRMSETILLVLLTSVGLNTIAVPPAQAACLTTTPTNTLTITQTSTITGLGPGVPRPASAAPSPTTAPNRQRSAASR